MNPLEFLETFSPKLRNDILSYPKTKSPPSVAIVNTSITNRTIYFMKHIQLADEYNTHKLANNSLFKFIIYTMQQARLEQHLHQHIYKNMLFYVMMMFCMPDQSQWYINVIFCINTDKHRRVSEFESLLDLSESVATIVKYMTQLYISLSNALFQVPDSSTPASTSQINSVSFVIYQDLVHILNSLYVGIYNVYMYNVNICVSELGYVPSYWPKTLKMRLCLYTNLISSNLIINTIQIKKPVRWALFPMQYNNRKEPIDTDTLIHFLCYLPIIDETDKDIIEHLNMFSDTIYMRPKQINGYPSIIDTYKELRPVSNNVLLRQYIVLHLYKWEAIWCKCKWPMTRTLYNTITIYRQSTPIPNTDLLFYILFHQIWQ